MNKKRIDVNLKKIKSCLLKGPKKLNEPYFNNDEYKFLKKCIVNKSVSTYGKEVLEFENLCSKFLQTKSSIALSSGTSALHMALYALDVNRNHEILVPSITFVATVNSIIYCGATPHFIDINLNDLNIDCDKLEKYLSKITIVKKNKCINKNTKKIIKAIIPVHMYGISVDFTKLNSIIKKFKLKVIEDAAEAFGTKFKNKYVGTYGDIGIFSFNGNKIITTGSGGLIVTKNKKLEKKIRHLISQSKIKFKNDTYSDQLGFNLKMSALSASLGLAQLKKINEILKRKKNLHNFYLKKFELEYDLAILKANNNQKPNNWINVLFIKGINNKGRNYILKKLAKLKIEVKPIWYPLHKMKYLSKYPKMNLINSEIAYSRCLTLPSSISF